MNIAEINGELKQLPSSVREAVIEAATDNSMNDAMVAVSERAASFRSSTAMIFAGLGMNFAAREHVDAALDQCWADNGRRGLGISPNSRLAREVVIGSGVHAAIYCAVRAATGAPKPLVVERAERAGGIFAVSRKPSFYLNSRNRPGPLSIPGTPTGSLNVLPEAALQPCDLNGTEYQVNSDVAWVVRTTLALHAHVVTGVEAVGTRRTADGGIRLDTKTEGAGTIRTTRLLERIIIATGLGDPVPQEPSSERMLTFAKFMARMDEPFPLRGMGRVAVIGAGDSGRTVIEALTGQGPQTGWSSSSLDYPVEIDWYGGPNMPLTRSRWEECNRSRYKGIGRLLPRKSGMSRVRAIARKATRVSGGYRTVNVNGRPYDYVINCKGFARDDGFPGAAVVGELHTTGSRYVARVSFGGRVFFVGPAANLPIKGSEVEVGLTEDSESKVAIFRYAGETAALAESLG